MRMILVLLLCFTIWQSVAGQQPCPKYRQAMQAGSERLAEQDFKMALLEFQAAQLAVRECKLGAEAALEAATRIKAVFSGLQQQRDAAKADIARADRATALVKKRIDEARRTRENTAVQLARADTLNRANERLINSLYFYADRFAMAVIGLGNRVQYGFIDKQGNTRIEFIYDQALPFEDNGFARVERAQQTFLIDTSGNEYLLAETLDQISPDTRAVDLRYRDLEILPDTLCSLPDLQVLLVSYNDLATIPASLEQLSKLRYLGLAYNDIERLPPEIGKLTELQNLQLSSNQLKALPEEIAQLKKLRSLNLSINKLELLPSNFSELIHLQSLHLNSNQLQQLPAAFGQLAALEYLDLSNNHLAELPASFKQLIRLKHLYLGDNQLASLPPGIETMTALEEIDLFRNKLPDLPVGMGGGEHLRKLDVRMNPSLPLAAVCKAVKNSPLPIIISVTDFEHEDVEHYDYLRNSRDKLVVKVDNVEVIPDEIGEVGNLYYLDLYANFGLKRISPEIGKLAKLEILQLGGYNNVKQLPAAVGALRSLRELYLHNTGLTSLPESIGRLTNLEILDLSRNNLERLPTGLTAIRSLKKLDVSNNMLISLPESIGGLTNLEILDLSANRLEDLPSGITALSSLWKLDVSNNMLISLPDNIERLKNLQILSLGSNRLERLPPGLFQLEELTSLALNGNQLQLFPNEAFRLVRLKSLDLSGNQIGEIPPAIGKMLKNCTVRLYDNPIVKLPETSEVSMLLRDLIRYLERQSMLQRDHKSLVSLYQIKIRLDSMEDIRSRSDDYLALSGSLAILGHLAEAETATRKALQFSPSNWQALLNLPPILLMQGKSEAARAEYRRTMDLRCGDAPCREYFYEHLDNWLSDYFTYRDLDWEELPEGPQREEIDKIFLFLDSFH